MKLFILSACLIALISFSSFAQDATAIIKKAEAKQRGNSSYTEMKIEIIRPSYTREISLKSWSLGKEFGLSLVTAPASDKGNVTLKRENEIWNYIPSIERSIKLPPSMMLQSWMGTDLTNDDLVRESSILDDYDQTLLGKEEQLNLLCYKIELIPHEDAAVVWGKVIIWIDTEDYMQLKTEFYDEDGFLVNTFNVVEYQVFDNRKLPSKIEVVPAEKEGHKTVMTTTQIEFDIDITESFFTTQNMKRVR